MVEPLSYQSSAAAIQAHEMPGSPRPSATAESSLHHPVVVVGAGPVGLTLAIDLAQRGQRVLLLDNDHRLSTGSRAICFAKRTLEIWDRLGVGEAMCAKGVEWSVGKVYAGEQLLYQFDLLPEAGHERPAFINLQQYYAEAYLAVRAAELHDRIELRWKHNVVGVETHGDQVDLSVDTPEGRYTLSADWVVACDGSRSAMRKHLGLESKGQIFRDRFLIADVRMQAEFPAERWFWFDPPFHRHQSVLLHRQPDGVWRIDFQLGWDADPDEEKKPERIRPRVDAMMQAAVGRAIPYELEWASVYTFACQRMERFQQGRVLFAGDSAHGVSPFGARGANSGVQDADNLGWKLARVLDGSSPPALLASYGQEREWAADENILNSTRSTDFITPKSEVSRLFRDAVLGLAREHSFARRLVNSGRLSVPTTVRQSVLNGVEEGEFAGPMVPGAPALDAPLRAPATDAKQAASRPAWLLRALGEGFALLVFGSPPAWLDRLVGVKVLSLHATFAAAQKHGGWFDESRMAWQRFDAREGTMVLIRPDQHVVARWREPSLAKVQQALQRAQGLGATA